MRLHFKLLFIQQIRACSAHHCTRHITSLHLEMHASFEEVPGCPSAIEILWLLPPTVWPLAANALYLSSHMREGGKLMHCLLDAEVTGWYDTVGHKVMAREQSTRSELAPPGLQVFQYPCIIVPSIDVHVVQGGIREGCGSFHAVVPVHCITTRVLLLHKRLHARCQCILLVLPPI